MTKEFRARLRPPKPVLWLGLTIKELRPHYPSRPGVHASITISFEESPLFAHFGILDMGRHNRMPLVGQKVHVQTRMMKARRGDDTITFLDGRIVGWQE